MSEMPQKIGFIAGNFDVLHPGYIYMFKEAKSVCDVLFVGLHTDPSIERPEKIKPILSIQERKDMLLSIKYIDEVSTYTTEEELLSLIIKVSPDVRLLGDDYKNRFDYTGYGICPKIYYFDRSHGWSTTKFKNLIYKQMKRKRRLK